VNEVSKAWENTVKTFSSMASGFENIKSSLSNKISETKNTVRDTIENTKNWFGDLWERVRGRDPNSGNPARAAGGNVYAGTTYRVNELGQELFTPTQNGTIINNATLRGIANSKTENSSRGNATFNITINATGLAGNDIAAAIRPAVIDVIDAAWTQASGNIVTRGATII
jgi:hypothetical protein